MGNELTKYSLNKLKTGLTEFSLEDLHEVKRFGYFLTHDKPDIDGGAICYVLRESVEARMVCNVSDKFRLKTIPSGDKIPEWAFKREMNNPLIKKYGLHAHVLMHLGYFFADTGGPTTPFDHHGTGQIQADQTSIALFLSYLMDCIERRRALSDDDVRKLVYQAKARNKQPAGYLKLSLEGADRLEHLIMTMQRVFDLFAANDATGADTSFKDTGKDAQLTPSTRRDLRMLNKAIARINERDSDLICDTLCTALDGIYDYLTKNPDASDRRVRELMMFSLDADPKLGRDEPVGFMHAVEGKFGADSMESVLFKSRAMSAYLTWEQKWEKAVDDFRDEEQTQILTIMKPKVSFGEVQDQLLKKNKEKRVAIQNKVRDRVSKLNDVLDSSVLVQCLRKEGLKQYLSDADLMEIAEAAIYQSRTYGQAMTEVLPGCVNSRLVRQKVVRELQVERVTFCAIKTQSERGSQVARFAPGEDGQKNKSQVADIVLQWYSYGSFMISMKQPLKVPWQVVYAINAQIVENKIAEYRAGGTEISGVNFRSPEMVQMLSEPERSSIVVNSPKGEVEIPLAFQPFYRGCLGTKFDSNSKIVELSFSQARQSILNTLENGLPAIDFVPKFQVVESSDGRSRKLPKAKPIRMNKISPKSRKVKVEGEAKLHRVSFVRNPQRRRWEAQVGNSLLVVARNFERFIQRGVPVKVRETEVINDGSFGGGRVVLVVLVERIDDPVQADVAVVQAETQVTQAVAPARTQKSLSQMPDLFAMLNDGNE